MISEVAIPSYAIVCGISTATVCMHFAIPLLVLLMVIAAYLDQTAATGNGLAG